MINLESKRETANDPDLTQTLRALGIIKICLDWDLDISFFSIFFEQNFQF